MRCAAKSDALKMSTSAAPPDMFGLAVASPGTGGVIKRDTKSFVCGAFSERWRTCVPTSSLSSWLPDELSFNTLPSDSRATKALPLSSITSPNG